MRKMGDHAKRVARGGGRTLRERRGKRLLSKHERIIGGARIAFERGHRGGAKMSGVWLVLAKAEVLFFAIGAVVVLIAGIVNIAIEYRERKQNAAEPEDEKDILQKKSYVQPSKAYDSLAKGIFGMAKKEYVCFGVDIFKNYCFKDVHTYTEKEFEEYLERN